MLSETQLNNVPLAHNVDPVSVAPNSDDPFTDPSIGSPEEYGPQEETKKGGGVVINSYFAFQAHVVRHILTLEIAQNLAARNKLTQIAGYIWRTFDDDTRKKWQERLTLMEARCMKETGHKLTGHLPKYTLDLKPEEIVAPELVQTAFCRYNKCAHGDDCAAGAAAALKDSKQPKSEEERMQMRKKRKSAKSRGEATEEDSPRARKRTRAGLAADEENEYAGHRPRQRRSASSRSSSSASENDELFDLEAFELEQALCLSLDAGKTSSRLPLTGSSCYNATQSSAFPAHYSPEPRPSRGAGEASARVSHVGSSSRSATQPSPFPAYYSPEPQPQPASPYAATDAFDDPSSWQGSPSTHEAVYAASDPAASTHRRVYVGSASRSATQPSPLPTYYSAEPQPQPQPQFESAYATNGALTSPSTAWQGSPSMHDAAYTAHPGPAFAATNSPQLPGDCFVFGAPGCDFVFDFARGLNFECDPEVVQKALYDLRSTMYGGAPAAYGYQAATIPTPFEPVGYSTPPSPWAPSSPDFAPYLGYQSRILGSHVHANHAPWVSLLSEIGSGISAEAFSMVSGGYSASGHPIPVSFHDTFGYST
ncbi:hypothetical protein PsYK624_136420 [Phanerochaete sordida]|uniref:Uncharacterized protein n=1 Tax=Phanerochaete sordida TaxID=48140 RepID=A0A9P3GNE3_9APHY|nr:hypothetical protein PsYK624_136420 [Phanerochaete sordida]